MHGIAGIAERIAERKSLGLSAEEFNAQVLGYLASLQVDYEFAVSRTMRETISRKGSGGMDVLRAVVADIAKQADYAFKFGVIDEKTHNHLTNLLPPSAR